MCELNAIGGLAVFPKILRDNRHDCHGHSHETILVDTKPYHIEPGKTTPGRPPWPAISTTACSEPSQWPYPRFWGDATEVCFLFVQVGCDVVAEEGEERGYCKRLVTARNNLEVYRVPVVEHRQEGSSGVDGNHE